MAAVAPAPDWTPKDDVLLKIAVEAGASLESLAKGAIQFSRRFTIQEIQDRWSKLLYDVDISNDASTHMVEIERSASTNQPKTKADFLKELSGSSRKRKTESVRHCYYAMRKRICNEPRNMVGADLLSGPGHPILEDNNALQSAKSGVGNALSHDLGIQVPDFDPGQPLIFEFAPPVSESIPPFSTAQSSMQNLSFPFEENLSPIGDCSDILGFDQSKLFPISNVFGDEDIENREQPSMNFGDSAFHSFGCASSSLPQMPVWSTSPDIPITNLPIHSGGNDQQAGDMFLMPLDGGVNEMEAFRTDGAVASSSFQASISHVDYLAAISTELLDFSHEDELFLMNSEKDSIDKSYLEGFSSLLLDSPSQVGLPNANPDEAVGSAEGHFIQTGDVLDSRELCFDYGPKPRDPVEASPPLPVQWPKPLDPLEASPPLPVQWPKPLDPVEASPPLLVQWPKPQDPVEASPPLTVQWPKPQDPVEASPPLPVQWPKPPDPVEASPPQSDQWPKPQDPVEASPSLPVQWPKPPDPVEASPPQPVQCPKPPDPVEASPALPVRVGPEYNDNGVICCGLNMEDNEIPSNDDVFLPFRCPSPSFPAMTLRKKDPSDSSTRKSNVAKNKQKGSNKSRGPESSETSNVAQNKQKGSNKSRGQESSETSNVLLKSKNRDQGVRFELPKSSIHNASVKNSRNREFSSHIRSANAAAIKAIDGGTRKFEREMDGGESLSKKPRGSACMDKFNPSPDSQKIRPNIASSSRVDVDVRPETPRDGSSNVDLTNQNAGVEETIELSSSPEQDKLWSEIDFDIPNYSDVEELIFGMDLSPNDFNIRKTPEVLRLQHEETKRTIMRLEQASNSCTRRSLAYRGAFAALCGRYTRHFIMKPEVLLGRKTEGVPVDIDLGRERNGNKISRRQATIKMDENGKFHMKNHGKPPIFINGNGIAVGVTASLIPGCLVQIKGMAYLFETNVKGVKRYVESMAKKPSQ